MSHLVSLVRTFVVCAVAALWLDASTVQAQTTFFMDGFTANDNSLNSVLPSGALGPPVTLAGLPSDVPRHDITVATVGNTSALWVLSSSLVSGDYYLTIYPRNPFTGGVAGPPILTNIRLRNGTNYGLDFGGGFFWILESTRPATIYQIFPATGAVFHQINLSAAAINNWYFEDVAFDGPNAVLWVVGDSGVCCGLPAIFAINPSTGTVVSGPTNLPTLSAGAGDLSKRIARITPGTVADGVLRLFDTAASVPAIHSIAANGMILSSRALDGFPHVPNVSEMAVAFGCVFDIPLSITFPSSGGPGALTLATSPGCVWGTSTPDSWITVPGAGAGSGTLTFNVSPNTTGGPRTGTINVGGLTLTITQEGGPCAFSLSPTSQSISRDGGVTTLTVKTNVGCAWTATSNDPWINILYPAPPSGGIGGGSLMYMVAPNTTADSRTGTVTIAGLTFTIIQSGCVYSVSPTSGNIPVSGGSGSFGALALTGCSWTAKSTADWINLAPPGAGTGNGTVGYSVSVNPTTGQRSGTITISDTARVVATYTIAQLGNPCPSGIAPNAANVPASGGSGVVSVTSVAACNWTATSTANWITIAPGSSGSGNGTVGYTVAPNPTTSARVGAIKVNSYSVTISQDRQCTYLISPTSQSFSKSSHSGSVSVQLPSGNGCTLTATSSAGWLTVTSISESYVYGNGVGTVKYSVSANSDNGSRTGTMTIGGLTFTVTQAGACTVFSISPASQSFTASGGSGSVAVTAGTGCSWTVSGNKSWNTITSSKSGTGSGTVTYSVAANPYTYSRDDNVTIAGQTLKVAQAGR